MQCLAKRRRSSYTKKLHVLSPKEEEEEDEVDLSERLARELRRARRAADLAEMDTALWSRLQDGKGKGKGKDKNQVKGKGKDKNQVKGKGRSARGGAAAVDSLGNPVVNAPRLSVAGGPDGLLQPCRRTIRPQCRCG